MARIPDTSGLLVEPAFLSAVMVGRREFRRVLYTVPGRLQVTTMFLNKGEDIGAEFHPNTVQEFYVLDGRGHATVGTTTYPLTAGSLILVPAGVVHNITAAPNSTLLLKSTYSPPQHPHGTTHATKNHALLEEQTLEAAESIRGGAENPNEYNRAEGYYRIYPSVMMTLPSPADALSLFYDQESTLTKRLKDTHNMRIYDIDTTKRRLTLKEIRTPEDRVARARVWHGGKWIRE